MKKVAVITDAVSAGFCFPLWYQYYGGQFGPAALHVVTYAGLKPLFDGVVLGNLWALNAPYDDTLRAKAISDFTALLLLTHDVVLRVDVDEFLVPDAAQYASLRDFVERNDAPYVTARGLDVVELADDPPLEIFRPVFGVQRHWAVRATALNKTALTTITLRWAEGFHGASAPPHFARLYLFHLKFADLKGRIAWFETMRQGLVQGSRAYEYFSASAGHLTGVQGHLASLARGGAESEAEFDARFLATMRHNEVNNIHQGDFFTQNFLVPLPPMPAAEPDIAIAQFESLGHNSEFGFVMDQLGGTSSSLLRWAYIEDAQHLIAALQCRFAGLFTDPDRLVTRFGEMVQDPAFGIAFHTGIETHIEDNQWRIRRDAGFAARYENEVKKINAQTEKFLHGLAQGGKIYFYKENNGVAGHVALALHEALRSFGDNQLLVMAKATDEIPPGSVRRVRDGLYRGYVARFSAYDDVHNIDLPSWRSVLRTMQIISPAPAQRQPALNLALHKPALVSSIHLTAPEQNPSRHASGGNNGQINGAPGFRTAVERDPWWQVDLQLPQPIARVTLHNSLEAYEDCTRAALFSSLDGETWTMQAVKLDSASFGGENGAPYEFTLAAPFTARFVRIGMIGEGSLHLAEIEIFPPA